MFRCASGALQYSLAWLSCCDEHARRIEKVVYLIALGGDRFKRFLNRSQAILFDNVFVFHVN